MKLNNVDLSFEKLVVGVNTNFTDLSDKLYKEFKDRIYNSLDHLPIVLEAENYNNKETLDNHLDNEVKRYFKSKGKAYITKYNETKFGGESGDFIEIKIVPSTSSEKELIIGTKLNILELPNYIKVSFEESLAYTNKKASTLSFFKTKEPLVLYHVLMGIEDY